MSWPGIGFLRAFPAPPAASRGQWHCNLWSSARMCSPCCMGMQFVVDSPLWPPCNHNHPPLQPSNPPCSWFGSWEPNGWALHTLQERWGADVLLGAAIVKAFG